MSHFFWCKYANCFWILQIIAWKTNRIVTRHPGRRACIIRSLLRLIFFARKNSIKINSLITSEFFFAREISLVVSLPDNPDSARVGKHLWAYWIAVFPDSVFSSSCELAEWAGKRDSEDFLKSGLAELYFNLTVGFSTLWDTFACGAYWLTRASTIICLEMGMDGLNVISIVSITSLFKCIS